MARNISENYACDGFLLSTFLHSEIIRKLSLVLSRHQSVLSKGRSFTASAGTKAAVLPKAGLPPQTQKPRLLFYQGLICAVASRCFPHPTLSLAPEQTSKDLKNPRDTNVEVRRVDLGNWALETSPKFTTGVKYQFHQGF